MVNVNHTNRKHAKLSASGSHRWMNCTPSVNLSEGFKSEYSIYAAEGTLAHEFADVELRYYNKELTDEQYHFSLDTLRKHELYTDEMEEQVAKYTQYCIDIFETTLGEDVLTIMSIEERLDLTRYVRDSFGTGDMIIVGNKTLHIIDLKYGKGVPVSAYKNSQLMLYGLGAYLAYGPIFEIDKVIVHVGQPRLDSFDSYEISVGELLFWAEEVEVKAKMAFEGLGELRAGDWCRWCKIKERCPEYSGLKAKMAFEEFQLELPEMLSDEDLMRIYKDIKQLKEWVNAIDSYVKKSAIQGTLEHPGYKVVYGTAKRSWADTSAVLKVLRSKGFKDEQITNTKIKGIIAIQDLMSQDEFDEAFSGLVKKPQGAPTLVPNSDAREEFKSETLVAKEFS